MSWLDDPVTAAALLPPLILPLIVFVSAALEFIVPPYWGDTVILVAFFLTSHGMVSPVPIFILAFLGSLLGAAVALGLGRRFGPRLLKRFASPRRVRTARKVERLFNRFGAWILAFNRFLPFVRASMVYGAGALQLRFRRALGYLAISNLAWLGLLMTVATLPAGNWHELQAIFRTYSRWSGMAALAVVGLVLLGLTLWRLWSAPAAPPELEPHGESG